MPSFKTATKENSEKSGFVYVKSINNLVVKKIATTCDFQIGINNVPSSLKILGNLEVSGLTIFSNELRGSLTKLADGTTDFLQAGNDIEITKNADGSMTIGSTAASSGAPVDATYVVTTANGTLTNEKVLTAGANITITPGASTVTIASTGASAAGSDTEVQFNDGGTALGAEAEFTYNKTDYLLNIGQAQVGRWNASVNDYAVFKDKDSAASAYALLQNAVGKTFLNAASGQVIELRNNNSKIGSLSNNVVELTGQSGTATTTTIGNTSGASSVTIDSGTGAINIATSNSARDINIGTGTSAQNINIGNGAAANAISIGSNSTSSATINGGSTLSLYANAGTITVDSTGGSINVGTFGYAQTISIGNTTGGTSVELLAGTGGIMLTGEVSTSGDITVGGNDIKASNGQTALSLDTLGNVTVANDLRINGNDIKSSTGATTITMSSNNVTIAGDLTISGGRITLTNGSIIDSETTNILKLTESDVRIIGQTLSTDQTTFNLIDTTATTINIGGAATTVDIGAATGITTVKNRLHATGGTSLLLDAELGNAAVGSHPAFESTTPTAYAMFGHKDLNHAVDGNYALVQNSTGETFLGAASTYGIYLKNGTDAIGTLSHNTISLTGKSGNFVTTTIGNQSALSSTTIDAGQSGINIGTSDSARTINIGTTATTTQYINLGNNKSLSKTSIYGGFFGILMSGSVVNLTGSIPTQNNGFGVGADATIGNVEIGSLAGYGGDYAMFGHKELKHGWNADTAANYNNYAIAQGVDGTTYISSPWNKGIHFTSSGSLVSGGKIYWSTLFNKYIINFGDPTATGIGAISTFGSTTGDSSTNIQAGTGDINIGTSDSARTINIGTTSTTTQLVNIGNNQSFSYVSVKAGAFGVSLSGSYLSFSGSRPTQNNGLGTGADALIGNAEIGSLAGYAGNVAMFGHKELKHGWNADTAANYNNYAIAQGVDGTTYINSPYRNAGSEAINFTASGSLAPAGQIFYWQPFSKYVVNFGDPTSGGIAATVTMGSTTGTSETTINAGTGNINIGTSDSARTINIGTAATQANTINIGNKNGLAGTNIYAGLFNIVLENNNRIRLNSADVGKWAGSVNDYAVFQHKDMNGNSSGYALLQQDTGDTYLNCNTSRSLYLRYANSTTNRIAINSTGIGFFGSTPAAKQTTTNMTNNVSAGGTSNTLTNYTSLTTYSSDAAAIRGNFYQIGLKLNAIIDALQAYGLM